MPLGTLDREPPPFFRQGPSALSKLALCSALSLLLMVADVRFQMTQPLRSVLATVLYPVQWLALRPVALGRDVQQYFSTLSAAQAAQALAQLERTAVAINNNQFEQINLENARLRQLLGLRERLQAPGVAAQVLYDAPDPYTRKVILDKGQLDGLVTGSPVLDEAGVLGQVTRVYPTLSEVTLVSDREQAIPVQNVRTGARGVAYGSGSRHAEVMELRFMAATTDVAEGDLLATSGIDGVYPPGLMVARVERIERRVDAVFARIDCVPLARVNGSLHVMVLEPLGARVAPRPEPEPAPPPARKRGAGAAK